MTPPFPSTAVWSSVPGERTAEIVETTARVKMAPTAAPPMARAHAALVFMATVARTSAHSLTMVSFATARAIACGTGPRRAITWTGRARARVATPAYGARTRAAKARTARAASRYARARTARRVTTWMARARV